MCEPIAAPNTTKYNVVEITGETMLCSRVRRVGELGITYRDLNTAQSSLEDIFVDLVHNGGAAK
jgi:hypothetical protein